MDRMIVIEHADGRRYAVGLEDYRKKGVDERGRTYQQLGFRIVSWEGGEAYEPPQRDEEQAKPDARKRAAGGA